MNDRDLMVKRNDVARYFRHSSKIHRNCIRVNVGNTLAHERRKFEMCWQLLKEGKEILTEAEFENPFKLRADVVDLDAGVVYEIVCSENEGSVLRKKATYPLPIVVVVVPI